MDFLPKLPADQTLQISKEGFQSIIKNFDQTCPQRNYLWCTDYKKQLPVRVKKEGFGSQKPYTICQMWQMALKDFSNNFALNYEKEQNKWISLTFKQYYQESIKFGKALIAFKVTQYATVNIIGFNSVWWAFSFYGSIFGHYLPIGIYTTNGPDACQYIANHSQCQVVVMQDQTHLKKYIKILDRVPKIKYYILWKDKVPDHLPVQMEGRVFTWDQFIQQGLKMYKPQRKEDQISYRMQVQKPGNCCTFIYTSGTTGNPKAVMISHDNYTWVCDATIKKFGFFSQQYYGKGRAISMLPLSHVAAQVTDLIIAVRAGANIFFTDATALQGNLLKYLLAAKPMIFMSVPRVWQKMQEKMLQVGSKTTGLKKKLAIWAKSMGNQGTYAQMNNKPTPFLWSIAKKLVYNKVKQGLGLDECQFLIYSAAPLRQSTKRFFLDLNMLLRSSYGMSQLTGPQTFTDTSAWDDYKNQAFLKETGRVLPGLQLIIDNPDLDGNGQICLRGRNRFMGYFKNQQQTRKAIDQNGFLHSGDVGKLDPRGNLLITGRIKQLLITAGGQNVAPVLIENQIMLHIPIFAHVVVIGDKKKYLTCLCTLKAKQDNATLMDDVINYALQRGSQAKTVHEAIQCPKFNKIIQDGIEKANESAISKAQRIVKYKILKNQFSTDTDQLTPTLKLRRKIITSKYQIEIQSMYIDPKM